MASNNGVVSLIQKSLGYLLITGLASVSIFLLPKILLYHFCGTQNVRMFRVSLCEAKEKKYFPRQYLIANYTQDNLADTSFTINARDGANIIWRYIGDDGPPFETNKKKDEFNLFKPQKEKETYIVWLDLHHEWKVRPKTISEHSITLMPDKDGRLLKNTTLMIDAFACSSKEINIIDSVLFEGTTDGGIRKQTDNVERISPYQCVLENLNQRDRWISIGSIIIVVLLWVLGCIIVYMISISKRLNKMRSQEELNRNRKLQIDEIFMLLQKGYEWSISRGNDTIASIVRILERSEIEDSNETSGEEGKED